MSHLTHVPCLFNVYTIAPAILLYYIVFNYCNVFAYVIFMSIHALWTGQRLGEVLEF